MTEQVMDEKLTPDEAEERFVEALANGRREEAMKYLRLCPIDPGLALAIKRVLGMDGLKQFDLSDAKKVYPDEFA